MRDNLMRERRHKAVTLHKGLSSGGFPEVNCRAWSDKRPSLALLSLAGQY